MFQNDKISRFEFFFYPGIGYFSAYLSPPFLGLTFRKQEKNLPTRRFESSFETRLNKTNRMPDAFLDIRIIKCRGCLEHVSDVQISDAVFIISLTIFSRDLWCAHFYFF